MTNTKIVMHPVAGWAVVVPIIAYVAAKKLLDAGASLFEVFNALRSHGVPVRSPKQGHYPASQAATAMIARRDFEALQANPLPVDALGLPKPRVRLEESFDKLRGRRLTKAEAEHLVYKVLAPCLVGSGVRVELIGTGIAG